MMPKAERDAALAAIAVTAVRAIVHGIRSGAAMRWLRAGVSWRLVRKTDDWLYWENGFDGRRYALQTGRVGAEPIDRTFMRPGDILWGQRDGWQMVGQKGEIAISQPQRAARESRRHAG